MSSLHGKRKEIKSLLTDEMIDEIITGEKVLK